MAMPYLMIFLSVETLETLEALSDAERGRLLTAMCKYCQDGDLPSLGGSERVAWPMFRKMIDNASASYKAKVEAGAKGGNKKQTNKQKGSTSLAEASRDLAEASTKVAKGKQTPSTELANGQQKGSERYQELRIKNYSSAAAEEARAREGTAAAAEEDLNLIASQHTEVFDAAERYGFLKSQAHLDKLNALLSEYEPEWILRAMDDANDNNAVSFAYIRKILERWKSEGGMHDGRKKAPEGGGSEWDNANFLT